MTALLIAIIPVVATVAVFMLAGQPLGPDGNLIPSRRGRGHALLLYVFHLRYQLLITFVLLGLPAWGGMATGSVGNWMVIEAADIFLMVGVAELAAAAAVYAWWLAVVGLPERQGLPPLAIAPWATRLLDHLGRPLRHSLRYLERPVDRLALGAAMAAGIYYSAAATLSQSDARAERLLVSLISVGIALIIWLVIYWLAPHLRSLIVGLATQIDERFPKGRGLRHWLRRVLGPGFGLEEGEEASAPESAGAGSTQPLRVLDHGWMFARVALGLFMYIALYFSFAPDVAGVLDGCRPVATVGWTVCFPAVAYVLLLGSVLGLLLCFLAFLFDYVRAPVLLGLALLLALSFRWSDIDHHYPVIARPAADIPAEGLSLQGVLRARVSASPVKGAGSRLVVVAAAGGGIAAAGWTTTVMGGLDEVTQGVFGDRLAAVSAVSGGSFGAALFIDDHLQRPPASGGWQGRRERTFDWATANSLRPAFWGMVFPDLLRLFRPGFAVMEWIDGPKARIQDRSWAMEESWRRRIGRDRPVGWTPPSLAEVGRAAAEGRVAAPIINAMLVENGVPYALTPLALPEHLRAVRPDAPCPFISIAAALPERDLSIFTAARLSATFPYVTPMSRPVDLASPLGGGDLPLPPHAANRCGEQAARAHVGDGGYFDNFGVAALSAWMDDAFSGGTLPADLQVLWLNVYWEEPESTQFSPLSGAQVASQGPLSGLVNARGSTQRTRNRAALAALAEKWNRRDCAGCPDVERLQVRDLVLSESLPLNWQLGQRDKDLISRQWADSLTAAVEVDGPPLMLCPNAAEAWDTDTGPGGQLLAPGLHELPDESPDSLATRARVLMQNALTIRAVHAYLCLPAADGAPVTPP
ncbi:MAG: hypothetical protein ACH37Z_01285 [Anaerolineae bacterium]